ncbi:general stress protein [Psychrobacillus sp. INOP01]|uniref:general stress protein n=1 Tax=Psychrobacillus sp. INOP01 TaxID=2829187 RepID=UPI001BAA8302|nr:general stress protein [Psychrobacillus sp. INOP01]QUG40316.1 general stress protein [Psychrobacillus sp. INOP01]
MNIESNRRIEFARTEEEMYEKLEGLQNQGYAESDIHVISTENAHLNTLSRHSEVSTHEAGTFMDKFKSWFTGEDAVAEGLRKLDLSEEERTRYAEEVARGSIVLYTDVLTFNDEPMYGSHENEFDQEYTDTVGTDMVQNRFMENEEPISDYAKEQGLTPSNNKFVNETDGRFDEPQDRFARGETFATDPYLAREEDHIGHSMQEDRVVRETRPKIEGNVTMEEKTYGTQSPGADPNLGPAAYASETVDEEEERFSHDQYEEKLEFQKKLDDIPPTNRLY